jgi:hypothetical protein
VGIVNRNNELKGDRARDWYTAGWVYREAGDIAPHTISVMHDEVWATSGSSEGEGGVKIERKGKKVVSFRPVQMS